MQATTAKPLATLLSMPSRDQTTPPQESQTPSRALPPESLEFVTSLFERFVLHYGAARMAAHWGGMNAEKAKGYWGRKLLLMPRRNVAYALQYLPERPPNIDEFVAICRRCPPPPVAGLLEHTQSDEEREATRQKGLRILAAAKRQFPATRPADETIEGGE